MATIKGMADLAIILNVSRPAVYNWVARGLPHKRIGLGYYFNTKEVRDWLVSQNPKKYEPLILFLDKYNQD